MKVKFYTTSAQDKLALWVQGPGDAPRLLGTLLRAEATPTALRVVSKAVETGVGLAYRLMLNRPDAQFDHNWERRDG
jgi:hypothetical protein